MKKEFIPYEQALELKALGFDEPCIASYQLYRENQWVFNIIEQNGLNWTAIKNSSMVVSCTAPLYQQAFRWFREKYNIDAWVQPFTSIKSNGKMFLPDESYSFFIFKDGIWVDDKTDFVEPEEAELACLKKLIEIVKNK